MIRDINLICHKILGTLKLAAMTIKGTGSIAKGYIPIDKFQTPMAAMHYGTLVDIMNNPEKFTEHAKSGIVNFRDIKTVRENVTIKEYDWNDVSNALQTLEFNDDIKDESKGDWLTSETRILQLTEKGYFAYISEFYLKKSKQENYNDQLAASTLRTNTYSRRSAIWTGVFAGLALIFTGISLYKDFTEPTELKQTQQQQQMKLQSIDSTLQNQQTDLKNLRKETDSLKTKDTSSHKNGI